MFNQSSRDKRKLNPFTTVSEIPYLLAQVSIFISTQVSKSDVELGITQL